MFLIIFCPQFAFYFGSTWLEMIWSIWWVLCKFWINSHKIIYAMECKLLDNMKQLWGWGNLSTYWRVQCEMRIILAHNPNIKWMGARIAQSVEHRTLVRKFTDPWPHARFQVLYWTEFIACVKIISPCSLTWGTELQVPLKTEKVRLNGEGYYQLVKQTFTQKSVQWH
jgi:hypothetical protein